MRFRGNDSPAKGRHLPRMLVTILATLTVANVVSADPYVYSSPSLPSLPLSYAYKSLPRPSSSPPLPYVYTSPPLHPPPPPPSPLAPYGPRHHLAVKVVGKVYCLRCYNWKYPKMSHGKKHLKGAVIQVTCKVGDKKIMNFGNTKINGKFSITFKGFDYHKYGAKACKVKLQKAPKDSKCNIPTNFHLGIKGANLKVKSKTKYEVVFYALPFAYAPKIPYRVCKKLKPTLARYTTSNLLQIYHGRMFISHIRLHHQRMFTSHLLLQPRHKFTNSITTLLPNSLLQVSTSAFTKTCTYIVL
nr:pistil-specific extensin-like protein isoform X1 [Nicotiana tomentosiformis]